MIWVILTLVVLGCGLAGYRWRWGVAAAIAVGLLQDPLRKMVPGVPGYLAMAATPVWLAALASAMLSRDLRVGRFLAQFPRFARWCLWFGLYLLVPAVLTVTYGEGSWMIALLGAILYGACFLTLAAGWRYAGDAVAVTRVLAFYAIAVALLLIGGPLDRLGMGGHFAAIGTEAMGHVWVTHRTGAAVPMLAGFFRGPDLMGWHAALLTMVASILALRSRGWLRLFWIVLAVWGFSSLWLCGRRKMLAMVPLFWGAYLLLLFRFRGLRRLVPVAGVFLLVLGIGWSAVTSVYRTEAVDAFYLTLLDEVDEQLMRHGVDSVATTYRQAGFWGYGLGMSQQGLHHLPVAKPRLWQESAPGKLMAEFGVPGSILFVILTAMLLLTAYHVLWVQAATGAVQVYAGLFAILGANLASALVSAQVYGDPFIAMLLTFLVGLLLSGARRGGELEVRPCRY